jgi:two-component system CheB/CheR fusion protein
MDCGMLYGEEAYSIAICLNEFLGEKLHNKKFKSSLNISEKAIKKARRIYTTKADVGILSASRLKKLFHKMVTVTSEQTHS